ncbi:hypothetical protein LR090_05165 [Candidatus Bipolaricaulota bacterium]|nr:hypothetical protein [Candidatus Bipolaricaulota bacterium]
MLAIVGGTVLTPTEELPGATVLVEGGVIQAVGRDLEVLEGTEVIDATGKYVIPGLIDAHCHTGVFPDGVGWRESDGNEMTDPITPQTTWRRRPTPRRRANPSRSTSSWRPCPRCFWENFPPTSTATGPMTS